MFTNFQVSFFNSYPVHVNLLDCSSLILLFLTSNFFKLLWILILIPPSNVNGSNDIISINISLSNVFINHLNIVIHILKHVKVSTICNASIRSDAWKHAVLFVSLGLEGHFNFLIGFGLPSLLIKLIISQVFTFSDISSIFSKHDRSILSHLKRLEVILTIGFI